METNNSSALSRLFSYLVVVATSLQIAITAMPLDDKTVVSAIILFVTIVLTAIKQKISVEVDWKKSKWPTIFLLIVAVIGAANEAKLIDLANWGPVTSQWIRVGLTFVVLSLNEAVKSFFPTYEAKKIENLKSDLKEMP